MDHYSQNMNSHILRETVWMGAVKVLIFLDFQQENELKLEINFGMTEVQ